MKLKKQAGAALVEAFFISGVLTIFLIGIPMLGKSIDLKQTTIQASRYAAWEKTVYVDPTQVDQVDTRFFKDASAPISSSAPADLGGNFLWGAGQQQSGQQGAANTNQANANQANANTTVPTDGNGGLSATERSRVRIVDGSVNSEVNELNEEGEIFGKIGSFVQTTGEFLSPDGWENEDPYVRGIVQADVSVEVQNNPMMFQQGGKFVASTAIMIDGWSAADQEIIRERVHGFVPTNRLERVGDFISKVKVIPMLDDLEHLEKAFGCVKTAIVPGKEINDPLPAYTLTGDDRC
jgi:Flp pilus assembly protein TadG